MAQNYDEEQKIVRKINRFMTENELDLLFDAKDIKEAIDELKNLLDSYDELHIGLKRELGEELYNENYKNFDTVMKSMTDYILNAKKLIIDKKSSVSEMESKIQLDRETHELTMTKNGLVAEEEFCRNRISKEIGHMKDQKSEFVEELDQF